MTVKSFFGSTRAIISKKVLSAIANNQEFANMKFMTLKKIMMHLARIFGDV